MIRAIPNINTARLSLSAMRPEDFSRFAEIWACPEVVRHIGGDPWSRQRAWESFLRNAGHWHMAGFGQWAILDQRKRRMIGQTGFFYGTAELGEDFDAFPEAGWVLAPEAQAQGLAREATAAAHDWFDRVIPGPLVAKITIDNVRSLKLAEALGYKPFREAEVGRERLLLLRRNGPPGGR